jgi:hypothetical protein
MNYYDKDNKFWKLPVYSQALPKAFPQIHQQSAQHYTPVSVYWCHLGMKLKCETGKDLDKLWALSRAFEPASPNCVFRSGFSPLCLNFSKTYEAL